MADNDSKKSYSYGKRPLWQWIVIYIIIGGIIYALLYYSGILKIGNYKYNSSNPSSSQNSQYNYSQ